MRHVGVAITHADGLAYSHVRGIRRWKQTHRQKTARNGRGIEHQAYFVGKTPAVCADATTAPAAACPTVIPGCVRNNQGCICTVIYEIYSRRRSPPEPT